MPTATPIPEALPDAADKHHRGERAGSVWFANALLPSGWCEGVRVGWHDGAISAIQINVPAPVGEERYAVGLPGLGNVHSHAFQRGIAGLTEYRRGTDNFWSWRDAMYRFVAQLDPEALEAITAQAYLEMLESGITRVGEFHYLHHARDGAHYAHIGEHAERIAAAAADTGIGLTLLPVFYAHGGVGGQPATPAQRRFINSLDSFVRLLEASREATMRLPFGNVGVAAHSLRAVTPEQLQQLVPLAGSGPLHIHIAEQQAEVHQWLQWAGCRPVEWLLDHAEIGPQWCLVHATHVTAAELARLAATRAIVGLCPSTEANLGDGIFPAEEFLTQAGSFGIGTDSNVRIDFAEELRLLEYGQRLLHRQRNVLHRPATDWSTGRVLVEQSLAAAQSVLHPITARLAPGCIADFIGCSDVHPSCIGRSGDTLLDSWIFAGAPTIDSVWSAGRKVVSGGRHEARERIAARYTATLAALLG
jgi:formimidoylglutamate deiminase